MKRRPAASGKPARPRSPKTTKAKRRNKPNEAGGRGASVAREESEVARLSRELHDALERQAATSEVLSMVSSSSGELDLVFRAILEKATRICEANFGLLFCLDNGVVQTVVMLGLQALAEVMKPGLKPGPNTATARAIRTGRPIHIPDIRQEKGYLEGDPMLVAGADQAGIRTLLAVPMVHNKVSIGSIGIYRTEVRPFTDKQIALVTNFAAQAVIAIENARLLNELRQRTNDLTERTADLTEALEQQTATSEVLQVISSSPGDLEPVFATMLENATRVCEASFGVLPLYEGEDRFRVVAMHNVPSAYAELRRREPVIRPGPLVRMATTKQGFQISDMTELPAYQEKTDPDLELFINLTGVRTNLGVPLLKDNEFIGAITVYRTEVRPFAAKQMELLKNFAAQAVIAIENTRLLNELRQRTTDLTEALEQQTATSEVLQTISKSPGELQPVFHAMLSNAVQICDAKFGNLLLFEDGAFRTVALHGAPQPYLEERQREPVIQPKPGSDLGQLVKTKQAVHVPDIREKGMASGGAIVELAGARTILTVPMVKESDLIGAIGIYRQEVRPFTTKQIALVENFAAQAVIAIENTRLLRELRERTDDVVKLNQQLEQRVADQVGEIERMSRLRRFLPPQVADLIVASGTEKQLESHRREITALFCDLRGFTGFSESADPEDVMTLLREYHEAIGESIIKYSGTLERYAGDGVMVVFNDPVPVENPALQAVLMALEMRDAIAALTETWRRWGHDIGFGIGIAHGFATLGTIGFEGRFDYAAIGTVSNVASRLCDEAKPGQILISPRVLTKVENAVKVEPVGEFELKGIRRPLAAYNVVSGAAQGLTPRS
jgi:class 3 adenylate cyclase